MEDDKELSRQSRLLEQLEGNEAFRLWRSEVCDPMLAQLDMALASSDGMPEATLRAKVQLRYLVRDLFYGIFSRVRAANERDRELEEPTNK